VRFLDPQLDRRRGDNHDAVNTVRQKLNAFADALVKQVKILPDPFYLGGNMKHSQKINDQDCDDFDDLNGVEPACMDCGGEGVVDSVSESSGRILWDDDGPGTCPNCCGSGLRKDQQWF
jgi:hypothetical protein